MKCPKCQFDNPDDAKFCIGCGDPVEFHCPTCGAITPATSRFCKDCGHELAAPPAPREPLPQALSFEEKLDKIQRYLPGGLTEKILAQRGKIEGKRKQVTVMFCDMEGFTPLSERLEPEEVYSIVDEVFEILIHKVHEYEGTVNEWTGDGIMALFGAPIAVEDAPQRAIRSTRYGLSFGARLTRRVSLIFRPLASPGSRSQTVHSHITAGSSIFDTARRRSENGSDQGKELEVGRHGEELGRTKRAGRTLRALQQDGREKPRYHKMVQPGS